LRAVRSTDFRQYVNTNAQVAFLDLSLGLGMRRSMERSNEAVVAAALWEGRINYTPTILISVSGLDQMHC
jgi:hypothetical protein